MKISVKIIKENEDGSANAQVDFDKEGLETLVQWCLVSILTKAIDEYRITPEKDGSPTIARAKAIAQKRTKKQK